MFLSPFFFFFSPSRIRENMSGRCIGPMSTVSFSPSSFADEFDSQAKALSDGKLLRLRRDIETLLMQYKATTEESTVPPASCSPQKSDTTEESEEETKPGRASTTAAVVVAQLAQKLTDAFFAMPLSRCLAIGCSTEEGKNDDAITNRSLSDRRGEVDDPSHAMMSNASFFADDLVSVRTPQGHQLDDKNDDEEEGAVEKGDECITLHRYDVLFYAIILQNEAECRGSPLLAILGDPSDFLRKGSSARSVASPADPSAPPGAEAVCWWVAASVTMFRQPLAKIIRIPFTVRVKRWIEIGLDVWRSCPARVNTKLLQLITIFAETAVNTTGGGNAVAATNAQRDEKIFASSNGHGRSINMVIREVAERMTADLVRKHWSKIRPALHNGSTTVHCRTLRGWNRYFLLYHHEELQLDPATVSTMVKDIWSDPASDYSKYAANFLMRHDYFTSLFVPTVAQLATAFPQCPFLPALAASAIVTSCRSTPQLPQLCVDMDDDDARGQASASDAQERKTLYDAKILLQQALEVNTSFPYAWATLKSVLQLIESERPHVSAGGRGGGGQSEASGDAIAIINGKPFDAAACEDMFEESDVPAALAFPDKYAAYGAELQCFACLAPFPKPSLLAKNKRRQCRHCGHSFCDLCCPRISGFQKNHDRLCHYCYLLVAETGPNDEDRWLEALAEAGSPDATAAVEAYRRFFPLLWNRPDCTIHARELASRTLTSAELNQL